MDFLQNSSYASAGRLSTRPHIHSQVLSHDGQRGQCNECSQQTSIIAALKERVRELEIEAAITKSEKAKQDSGLQFVVGLLVQQQSSSNSSTSGIYDKPNRQPTSSQGHPTSLSGSLGPHQSSLSSLTPPPNIANDALATRHSPQSPICAGPAPKPTALWTVEAQDAKPEELIDISDEGYVSHFSSAEHAGEKGPLTLPKAPFAAVSPLTDSALCSVTNAMNQPGKPSLEGVHDFSPHMIDNSSNDGDEEDNISELDLQATRTVEKSMDSGIDNEKLPELPLRDAEAAATRIPSMEQEHDTGHMKQTTAAKLDKSFPIKPKCDINYLCYKPPNDTPDVYRTVLISNLPSKIRPEEILDKVRGGLVVSIKVLDTSVITGSSTATVEFLYELAAKSFQTHASQTKLKIRGNTIRVNMIKTPSWPIPAYLRSLIISGRSTRIMLIHKYPDNVSPEKLRQDMGMNTATKVSSLLCTQMRSGGIAEMCFSSVLSAQIARDCLIAHGRYRDCPIRFAPDPCALPYPRTFSDKGNGKVDSIKETIEGSGKAAILTENLPADEKPDDLKATAVDHDREPIQLLDNSKGNMEPGYDAAQRAKSSGHDHLTLPSRTSSTVEAMQKYCAAGCPASAEHVQALCINAWRQSLL